MSSRFTKQHCTPCESDLPPLSGTVLSKHIDDLGGGWIIVNDHHIEKEFQFKNFKEALAFTNEVGNLVEAEGHHPDIQLSYGKVRVILWTHNINGLSPNDFIIASKIDELKSKS